MEATEEREIEGSALEEREEEKQQPTVFMDLDNLAGAKEKKRGSSLHAKFINGLAVGFGIGCIATFIILWTSVFFSPKLPRTITYESLLSIFIYPLLYLLAIGLISLTAGLVKEFFIKSIDTN
jgi:fructose-specific phosphotransferase system IIC component